LRRGDDAASASTGPVSSITVAEPSSDEGGRDVNTRRWFVGIDWATEEHAVCLVDDEGNVLGERVFAHTGTGLAELCTWLLETTDAEPTSLFVSIEVPHGAVVETLLERGMVVHSINPKQLDRFRDRFTVAGAKDDRRDAHVLADSLRTDAKCFRVLRVDDPKIIELREWSRMVDDLQHERVRLSNRVRQQLLRYYPQMLELADDVANDSFLALWELVPTPAAAARIREKKVATLLVENRIRRFDAKHVLSTLRQKPLTVAPGTTEAATAHIAAVAERLRLLNRQIKDAHRRLDQLTSELAGSEEEEVPGRERERRDVEILRSLVGVGRIVLATLLAEASQPLIERDYHALRNLGGVAPVTKNSGKRRGNRSIVVMRRACNPRLRNAIYHWARVASIHDARSAAAYAELRKRGHSHGRALRTLADRLLAVACAMLRDRTLFDPNKRLAA
jgi:transposase